MRVALEQSDREAYLRHPERRHLLDRNRGVERTMKRGELWLAQVGRERRPVLLLTRSEVLDVRDLVTVAEITTSIRVSPQRLTSTSSRSAWTGHR